MTPEQVQQLLDWLKQKEKFHRELADTPRHSDAYQLNHDSRSLAFYEVYAEIRLRFLKGD